MNIVSTLQKVLIFADFKTVEKKFQKQNIDPDEIKKYFDAFKKVKERNLIKELPLKDIDYWGKKDFSEFKAFIESILQNKTKQEQKKIEKVKGANLVGQNRDWKVYRITTHEAAMLYGSSTKWCITEKDGGRWTEYSKLNNFYFIITNDPEIFKSNSAYSKIAVTVDCSSKRTYWDVFDRSHTLNEITGHINKEHPDLMPFPAFEVVVPTNPVTEICKQLKALTTKEIPPEIKEQLEDLFGMGFSQYLPEHKFLAHNICDDIYNFAETYHEGWFERAVNTLGTIYDDIQFALTDKDFEWGLAALKEYEKETYYALLEKAYAYKSLYSDRNFVNAFKSAWHQAAVEDTVEEVLRRLKIDMKASDFILLLKDDLFKEIVVGISLHDLEHTYYNESDLEGLMGEHLSDIDVRDLPLRDPSQETLSGFLAKAISDYLDKLK